MFVGVGSANPVKVEATADVLASVAGTTVESEPVDSGVSDQPFGLDETIDGARTRARRAQAAGYDLGVGIEGGVAEFDAADGLFLVMWAAVTDGDTTEVGSGPSLRLPDHVARRLRTGEELGPVMDDLLETTGVARGQGAAGVLTGGIVDRKAALSTAVAGALGPFVTAHY